MHCAVLFNSTSKMKPATEHNMLRRTTVSFLESLLYIISHEFQIDSVGTGRSGDRIPVGVIFSAPVQTGNGAHAASCTMGSGSLPGVKRPMRGVDHPHSSNAKVKEKVELYIYTPSGCSWTVPGWTFINFKYWNLPIFVHVWDTNRIICRK